MAEAAALLVGEGWIEAADGRFEPERPLTREEAAHSLARLIGLAPST
jgi:hypothetical protein